MNKFFNLDNPVMVFMSKIADLIILNILAIIFSIPIITIGASWTAIYYVTVKMVKNEESYIFKDFFNSFKNNFKQATLIWLLIMAIVGIFVGDFMIYRAMPDAIPRILLYIVMVIAIIVLCTILYVFPVLSHFENTLKNTIKNAFLISIINVPYTIIFLILFLVPIIFSSYALRVLPLIFMLGFSGPAYLASFFWKKIFKKLELNDEKPQGENTDSEFIENAKQDENV